MPFFSKRKVAESPVCQNLAAILSIAESSFAESSCNGIVVISGSSFNGFERLVYGFFSQFKKISSIFKTSLCIAVVVESFSDVFKPFESTLGVSLRLSGSRRAFDEIGLQMIKILSHNLTE